jgi:uncharacterized protein (TIGR00251 family)
MFKKALRRVKGGTVLRVQVGSGSAEDSWVGFDQWREAVKVKIAAERRGGTANEALVEFIARSFGIAQSSVEIVAGLRSRSKEVILGGVDEESANRKLMEVLKS